MNIDKVKMDIISKRYGGIKMAMLVSNKPNAFIIKSSKTNDFIKESNKNKVSNSFLRECQEIVKLFNGETKK